MTLMLPSVVVMCAQQMSVEQMAKATRGLPEFQELSKKMSQHVRLSQECMDKVPPCPHRIRFSLISMFLKRKKNLVDIDRWLRSS